MIYKFFSVWVLFVSFCQITFGQVALGRTSPENEVIGRLVKIDQNGALVYYKSELDRKIKVNMHQGYEKKFFHNCIFSNSPHDNLDKNHNKLRCFSPKIHSWKGSQVFLSKKLNALPLAGTTKRTGK